MRLLGWTAVLVCVLCVVSVGHVLVTLSPLLSTTTTLWIHGASLPTAVLAGCSGYAAPTLLPLPSTCCTSSWHPPDGQDAPIPSLVTAADARAGPSSSLAAHARAALCDWTRSFGDTAASTSRDMHWVARAQTLLAAAAPPALPDWARSVPADRVRLEDERAIAGDYGEVHLAWRSSPGSPWSPAAVLDPVTGLVPYYMSPSPRMRAAVDDGTTDSPWEYMADCSGVAWGWGADAESRPLGLSGLELSVLVYTPDATLADPAPTGLDFQGVWNHSAAEIIHGPDPRSPMYEYHARSALLARALLDDAVCFHLRIDALVAYHTATALDDGHPLRNVLAPLIAPRWATHKDLAAAALGPGGLLARALGLTDTGLAAATRNAWARCSLESLPTWSARSGLDPLFKDAATDPTRAWFARQAAAWSRVNDSVAAWLDTHYPDNSAVAQDLELQAFVSGLRLDWSRGSPTKPVPLLNNVQTRPALHALVAAIRWAYAWRASRIAAVARHMYNYQMSAVRVHEPIDHLGPIDRMIPTTIGDSPGIAATFPTQSEIIDAYVLFARLAR